ncbi:MAG: DUF2164 domain-containing protein [Dehalococcoidia bacterium]|nr:DUF2164 domain-containing protein [Dehalococcoidia bacterium]
MKKDRKRIRLSKEKREDLLGEIKTWFLRERDIELGELGAVLILDFIIEKLAPEFYNQGVEDARRFMEERVDDVLSIQLKRHYGSGDITHMEKSITP